MARRTILAEKVVRATNDELADALAELAQLGVANVALLLGRVAVSSFQDWQLEILAELLAIAEVRRVRKVQQRKVFVQVVLSSHT